MSSKSSWLEWLYPKCWFCKTEHVPFFGGHQIHIKHGNEIQKVKICSKCLVPLYRNGGITHVKKPV